MVTQVILWIIEAYVVVLLLRAVLSWFPISSGSPLQPVERVLTQVTEPVLAPVRRVLPPMRVGGTAIDLSMIVVIIVLELVAKLV
ncbi:MAG: YggT family protein [Actinomycetota bacterium]|nr:YggT family protein [Actinomycetota bacterium]MDA8281537.1 YggT family protein [Actinomycetota bacterium]